MALNILKFLLLILFGLKIFNIFMTNRIKRRKIMNITKRSEMKLIEEIRFKNIDEVMMYENELNDNLDKDYYFRLYRPLFSEDFILEIYLYCPEELLDY